MKNTHTIKKGIRPGVVLFFFLLLAGSITAQTTQNQVFEDWTSSSSTQNSFQRSIVRSRALGGTTYYYVAGATLNSGNYDMMVSKMTAAGAVLWTKTYDYSGGNDVATDVQIDAVGNVYICGSYYKNSTDSNNAIIIKYNAAGTQKWIYSFNGTGSKNDGLGAMLANGNQIFAVGTSWINSTNKYDMLQLRLDSSGTVVWQNTWNYSTANLNDAATNLYASGGALWIGGGAQSSSTNYKYALLKMVPATGVLSTTSVTGGTAFGFDKLTDLQQDINGNIYVTGGVLNLTTGYDFKTEKFDSTLTLLWSATYTGSGGSLDDVASGLYVDSLNNVIVTGYTNTATQGKNFATVKYNSSGTQQWASTFNGTANGNDTATSIVAKGTNIYVTGASDNGSGYDYYTIKYDGSGNKVWGMSWNSITNKQDIPTAIALDTIGGIVVTGQTKTTTGYNFMTVRYSQLQVIVPPDTSAAGSNALEFVSNHGQLRDLSYNSDIKVRYYCQSGTPEVFLQDNAKISLVLAKIDTLVSTTDSIVRVDMTYTSSNATIARAFNEGNDYNSYYLSHIPDGVIRNKNYKQVIYANLYSNIDLEFGNYKGGLKYSYIIKPGGNPANIDAIFTGATSVAMSGTNVRVTTALGNIDFVRPTAYQIDASGNFISLGWQPSYTIVSGHVKFTGLGTYNTTKPLIFTVCLGSSPNTTASNGNLQFCTYAGTSGDDYFLDVTSVYLGEVAVGYTYGAMFPQTAGGFGGNYVGAGDAIMFETQSDIPAFRCYIGGAGYDQMNAIALDGNVANHTYIYFAGTTGSPNIQTRAGAGMYRDSVNNGSDGFIGNIRADFSGFYPWATYFGGATGYETITDLSWDNGDLYFTGIGTSASPLQTETGATNLTTGKALIGKFNNNNSLTWCTLYGSGNGRSCSHYNGNLVVTGETSTSDLPYIFPAGNSYKDSIRNSLDAFIVRFNSSDNAFWATYYGGTSGDYGNGIVIDHNNDVYVCGQTGSSDFPFFHYVGYCDSTANGADAFMLKFGPTGQRLWASRFGGNNSDAFNGVAIDSLNNPFFFGYVAGNNNYTNNQVVSTYNQIVMGDNLANSSYGDGIIFMLNPLQDPKWCTYFGGDKQDQIYGGSINSAYPQKLVVAGAALSTTGFPWQGSNAITTQAGQEDAWLARFDLSVSSNILSIQDLPKNNESNFILYPNPGDGHITIQLGNNEERPELLTIYNAVGQLVYSQKYPESNNGQIILDLNGLGNGIYFINLQYTGKVESNKFSIIR